MRSRYVVLGPALFFNRNLDVLISISQLARMPTYYRVLDQVSVISLKFIIVQTLVLFRLYFYKKLVTGQQCRTFFQ